MTFHSTDPALDTEESTGALLRKYGSSELKHKVDSECIPDWAGEKEARAEHGMRKVHMARKILKRLTHTAHRSRGSETGLLCTWICTEAGEWHQLGWRERPGARVVAAVCQ